MKILFIGDSITDTGRNTDKGSTISIGQGYAMLIDACLSVKEPGAHTFVNTGISGNRIVDLYARIKTDMWNHTPDLISVLIGVNDVWHEFGNQNGVEAARFETVYRMFVRDTQQSLPGTRFMLLEPFCLSGAATDIHGPAFREEVEKRAAATERIARETDSVFVPLQKVLDDACAIQPAEYWLADGVHPTPAGHYLIAEQWIAAYKKAFNR